MRRILKLILQNETHFLITLGHKYFDFGVEFFALSTIVREPKLKRTKEKKPSPLMGRQLPSVPNSILPIGIDGRSRTGRRLRLYSTTLAMQTPNSDDPIVRARIVNAAALLVEAEKLAWRVAEGKHIDAKTLASLTYATDMALGRLIGRGLNAGHPRKDGTPAGSGYGPNGTRGKLKRQTPFLH